MNALRAIVVITAAAGLLACNQRDPATRTEEGVYGSSSGPNPNLSDLQADQPAPERPPADPATPGENAYPSQMGQPGEPSTGAEGGRGSAETGATDDTPR
ncbi:MAG: hypothetical protein ACT4OF_17235 [Caulobacteraceae bacterium]